MVASAQLQHVLEAAASLCGERDERVKLAASIDDKARLQIRLETRLKAYRGKVASRIPETALSLEEQTGRCALESLLALHDAVLQEEVRRASQSSSGSAPVLGVRDLHLVQTLLSIASGWRLLPLIRGYDLALRRLQQDPETQDKLVELSCESAQIETKQVDRSVLASTCFEINSILNLVKPLIGQQGARSEVTNAFMHSCMAHIASLGLRLAYGPVTSRSDSEGKFRKENAHSTLQTILRSLSTVSALYILSAAGQLGGAVSRKSNANTTAPIPKFVKGAIERLYSAQLLRADGVMALLRVVLGNEEDHIGGGDLMKKLASIGHLLSTPPPGMDLELFASLITPRLLDIISETPSKKISDEAGAPWKQSTDAQKSAAAYALARLSEVSKNAVSLVLQSQIWTFINPENEDQSGQSSTPFAVEKAVVMLHQLVERSEPSVEFITFLIRPVWIPLFTVSAFLQKRNARMATTRDSRKTDEILQSSLSLLKTYLRLESIEDILKVLSPLSRDSLFETRNESVKAIKMDEKGRKQPYWTETEGAICVDWRWTETEDEDIGTAISMLGIHKMMPILTSADEEPLMPSGLLSQLNLSPSSTLLTSLLKDSQRKDVVAQLLSDLLEAYSSAKQKEAADQSLSYMSSASIMFLQHVTELINSFGEEVLGGQAEKILQFVSFSLGTEGESSMQKGVQSDYSRDSTSPFQHLLNINPSANQNSDSANAAEEVDTELIQTALNLLLSLLEGNKDISLQSHSILKVIVFKLDRLSDKSNDGEVQHLAREAKLVLKARQSAKISQKQDADQSTPLQRAYAKGNEMYQEALKLLQDPILPVRAHGLVMLKDLASHGSVDTSKGILMDPALTSAIVDIYVQAIEDDESFLYLNAVKGLAEMANTGGREMIRRLMGLYLTSHDATYSKPIVDRQLRVGEALLQVVQKLEEALSAHVDEIVGPLLGALRGSKGPTSLRTSYLSVLGTCVEACPSAFSSGGLSDAVVDGLLDLLSVETTRVKSEDEQDKMQDPTHLDPKLPQLRRAAVLLLALLIRGSRHQLEFEAERREQESIDQEGLSSLRLPNGSIIGGGHAAILERQKPLKLLFNEDKTGRTTAVVRFLAQMDSDSLVRHQCSEVLQELQLLTLARLA